MTFNKLWSEGDERQQKYCQSGQPGQDEVWGCIAPVRRVSHIYMVLSQGTYSSSPQQQTVVEPRPAMYWVEHLFSCPVQLAGMMAIPTLPPLQPCSHWLWDELKCVTCCLYTCIAYREMVTFRPLHFLSPPLPPRIPPPPRPPPRPPLLTDPPTMSSSMSVSLLTVPEAFQVSLMHCTSGSVVLHTAVEESKAPQSSEPDLLPWQE